MLKLSISRLAEETGISRELIRRALRVASAKPAGKVRGYDVFKLRDALEAIYNAGPQDPGRMSPMNRKFHHEAKLSELRYLERVRQLCDVDDVRGSIAGLFKILVRWAATVPDKLERDAGISGAQSHLVERSIDELREELFAEIVAFDNEHPPTKEGKNDDRGNSETVRRSNDGGRPDFWGADAG